MRFDGKTLFQYDQLFMTEQVAIPSQQASNAPDDNGVSDAELMAAIKLGDKDAFEQLYDRHVPTVYALCLRVLHRDCEAEAVVSDVFWEIWRKPHRFDPLRGSCCTYLLTLARSRAVDRWRASKTRIRKTQDSGQTIADEAPRKQLRQEPSQLAVASERQQAVRAAVEQLDTRQRDTLMLAYFDGLTHREISERLEMPLGTVKTRIRNGLRSLRKALSTLGDRD